jgi:hypothetical protein
MSIITEIKCRRCGEIKGLECFKASRLKHKNYLCRECERAYKREYRKRPYVRAKKRIYARNLYKRLKAEGRIDNTKKTAVKRVERKLPKATTKKCQDCEKQAILWHHPNGYGGESALDVVPLCGRCHKIAHGVLKP